MEERSEMEEGGKEKKETVLDILITLGRFKRRWSGKESHCLVQTKRR